MRDINEYTAEVLRRSENRIKERRKRRNKILALGIPLCIFAITLFSVTLFPNPISDSVLPGNNENAPMEGPPAGDTAPTYAPSETAQYYTSSDLNSVSAFESFSFSLTWNCYGESSYNSETGELIKTTHASIPEDYITTYFLTDEQKLEIYDLIIDLNMASYPDKYDPHEGDLSSSPSMTLVLTVKDHISEKTIAAENIALTFESDNKAGQKFLSTCEAIQNILTSTDEWQELPDYEFLYE